MWTCIDDVTQPKACLVDCKLYNRALSGAHYDTPLGASVGLQGPLVPAHPCAAWLAAPQTGPPGVS